MSDETAKLVVLDRIIADNNFWISGWEVWPHTRPAFIRKSEDMHECCRIFDVGKVFEFGYIAFLSHSGGGFQEPAWVAHEDWLYMMFVRRLFKWDPHGRFEQMKWTLAAEWCWHEKGALGSTNAEVDEWIRTGMGLQRPRLLRNHGGTRGPAPKAG